MPTTTIPILLNISVVLPEGVTLAPQVGGNTDAWQYTAAPEKPAPGPQVTSAPVETDAAAEEAALRTAELEQFLAELPAAIPESAGFNDEDLTHLQILLREQLQEDLDRRAAAAIGRSVDLSPRKQMLPEAASTSVETDATKDALIARMHATIERLEDEVRQLRDELRESLAAAALKRAEASTSSLETDATKISAETDAASTSTSTSRSTNENTKTPHSPPRPKAAAKPKLAPQHERCDDLYDIKLEDGSEFSVDGYEIPTPRRKAAVLLAAGATFTEAGRNVGVTRKTVHSWKRNDPAFRALYNTYLNEFQDSTETLLLGLADKAAGVYLAHIDAGSLPASHQLLKGLGFFSGKPRQRTCELAAQLATCASDPPHPPEPPLHVARHPMGTRLNGAAYASNGA